MRIIELVKKDLREASKVFFFFPISSLECQLHFFLLIIQLQNDIVIGISRTNFKFEIELFGIGISKVQSEKKNVPKFFVFFFSHNRHHSRKLNETE